MAGQNSETRYRVREHEIAAKRFDDEVVIINLSTAMYYAAEGTGAWIWSAVATGHARGQVVDHLAKTLNMDAAALGRDIVSFIDKLVDEGLIEPASEAFPAPDRPIDAVAPAPRVYAPPLLEAYGDMAGLLALDPPMPEPEISDSAE